MIDLPATGLPLITDFFRWEISAQKEIGFQLERNSCPLWVKSRHVQCKQNVRFGPNNGLMQRSKKDRYSSTSSARASTDAGTARPSALAVARLMTKSNLVGCSTGRSSGFAPRRILSTYSAARRNNAG